MNHTAESSKKLLLAGILGCLLYVVGDFLYAALGRGQTAESFGFMVKVAYLEMGTWRMVASILCGFVGTLLYYMGFHTMYGLLNARVPDGRDRIRIRLFRVAYITGTVAWTYVHAIVNCAMFSAFLLSMARKPDADRLADYYARAMMTKPMRWFCRMEGKKKFGKRDLRGMAATAALNAADRNPYSWNMELLPYADGGGYEARFSSCGICTLMRELGLSAFVPAMCRLDYAMADAGGVCDFVRKYTLASGGPYCDCGYRKKNRS